MPYFVGVSKEKTFLKLFENKDTLRECCDLDRTGEVAVYLNEVSSGMEPRNWILNQGSTVAKGIKEDVKIKVAEFKEDFDISKKPFSAKKISALLDCTHAWRLPLRKREEKMLRKDSELFE